MTRKTETCDHCGGSGKTWTECGWEGCDHCDKDGKVRKTQTDACKYSDFDGYEALGVKPILQPQAKITIGMHLLFNKDKYGDYPLIVIPEAIVS